MAPEPAASGLPGAYSGRRVAPSILAADYSRLGEHVGELLAAGARVIHVDVMDGDFVPPISVGPAVAGSIADRVHDADGVLDCHLMIERPEAQIDEFARAGADSITVHFEATAHAHRALGAIREAGCLAGLAMNPGTPVGVAAELGELIDILLCMSVNPGWGGQSFIPSSPDKVRRLGDLLPGPAIEVDGGIDIETIASTVDAGATLYVAGSAVLGQRDPAAAYRRLAEAAGAS
jgi:ribulose-phosphate 3-epimerase